MARDRLVLPEHDRNSPHSFCNSVFVLIICFVVSVNPALFKNSHGNYQENEIYSMGNTTNWHHCPQGWTLFKKQCYKVTEAALSWSQAQALCRSYGGNLIKVTSLCEQNWMSLFVRDQLEQNSHADESERKANSADVPGVEAWIGFIQLPDKTFQWSDGQVGVEKDGFWADNGLKTSDGKSESKLCCDIRESPVSADLRWQLSDCEELRASVCELAACEEHMEHCADGSKCFNKARFCDGFWDCQDGSDEKDCKRNIPGVMTSTSEHCGSVFTGKSGNFRSPNFPNEYPPFMNCVWKIKAEPPQIVEILVSSLDIEEKYDTLNIYEGTEISEENLIVSLGGKASNQTVRSLSSFLTLHFVSDHSVQAYGFNISWEAEPKPASCGGQLLSGDEELLLNFSQSQLESSPWSAQRILNCDWLISSPSSNSLLSLQFRNITLESGDSITVYDGKSPDAAVITHITSSGAHIPGIGPDFSNTDSSYSLNIPPVMTSYGQQLLLHVIIHRGSLSKFVVAYKNGCDSNILSYSSMILSPGHPISLYPNNLNCTWKVSKDWLNRRLTLLFLPYFYTESVRDYVEVNSSETELLDPHITQISGQRSVLQSGISSLHGFMIKFVSDSTVNNGRWAAVISYDCPGLSVLPPLILNTSNTRFGTTVGYSCSEGFRILGPTHSVCGWSGQWQPQKLPTCTKINCGSVPVPHSAYLTNVTGVTYGNKATFKCFYGYTLEGHDEATCVDHGWERLPVCHMITCPKERPPDGGTALAEEIRVGYQREYFCQSGLRLVGSKYSHCDITGHWTDQVPRCEAQQCPDLQKLINGQQTITGPVEVGRTTYYSCNAGYRLLGNDELTCRKDLTYDYPLPTCIDIDECEKNICGIHQCQNYVGGYNCLCKEGYQHLFNSTHDCVDIDECLINNGGCSHECKNLLGKYKCDCPKDLILYQDFWNHIGLTTLIPNKTCIASCKPLVVDEEAKIVYTQKPLLNSDLFAGTEAYIVCPHNKYSIGASVTSCLPGKGWSSSLATCIENSCTEPAPIKNGDIYFSDFTLGSSVVYTCHQNHILHGPNKRFCVKVFNNDLQFVKFGWTGSEPSCVYIACPELPSPVGGTVNYSSTAYKTVAVFRCQCGYRLLGQSVVKCMSDGKWSHSSPTCEAQSCIHPGLPSQAIIAEYKSGFPVQSDVRFQCLIEGYQLSNQDPVTCLPYKETKVSDLKPFVDLMIRGQFVAADFVSLEDECAETNRAEDFIKQWSTAVVQSCQFMNVLVDIQEDTCATSHEDSLNTTLHIVVSSDNVSTTCQCHQQILSYMATINMVKTTNQGASCPMVSWSLKSALTFTDKWGCAGGLRFEGDEQPCKNGTSASCMEECIHDGMETLNSYSEPTPAPSYKVVHSTLETDISTTLTTMATSSELEAPSITSTLSAGAGNKYNTWKTAAVTAQYTTTAMQPELYFVEYTTSDPRVPDSSTSSLPHERIMKETDSFTKLSLSTVPTAESSSIVTKLPSTIASGSKETNESPSKTTSDSKVTVQPPSTPSGSKTMVESSSSTALDSKVTTEFSSTKAPDLKTTVEPPVATGSVSKLTAKPPSTRTASHYEKTTERPLWSDNGSRSSFQSNHVSGRSLPPHQSSHEMTLVPSTPSSQKSKEISIKSQYSVTTSTSSSKNNQPVEYFSSYIQTNEPQTDSPSTVENVASSKRPPKPPIINCTTYIIQQSLQNGKGQLNSVEQTEFRGNTKEDGGINDCLTLQNIEKQTVTFGHGLPQSSEETSTPLYIIEAHDYMWGSFANMSCIDAVHVSINAKVNELLREFGNEIGISVCKDSDAALELAGGNIRFKNVKAKIYIKFSITYLESSSETVASCAKDFQEFITSKLPLKFDKVEMEVTNCTYFNYTKQMFNITYNGWSCPSSYMLDERLFQCYRSVAIGSPQSTDTLTTTSSTSTTSFPIPALTVPLWSMTFTGAFISTQPGDKVDEKCLEEYKSALIEALSTIEQRQQSRRYMDIYTTVDKDVKMSLTETGVVAEITVNLIPLSEHIDLEDMFNYANITSLQFHSPSQQIPLTSDGQLSSCPVLQLSPPHGMRTNINKIKWKCSPGYYLCDAKCVNENLPLYSIGIKIAMKGSYEELVCENITEAAAQKFVETVFNNLHGSLTAGNICNGTKNFVIFKESPNVTTEKNEISIIVPLTLVSLQGNQSETMDCVGELYNLMKFNLSQPIREIINILLSKCGAKMSIPQNYAVSYRKWSCSVGREYNSTTHACSLLSLQTTQTPATVKGPSLHDRHKRGLLDPLVRPQWNSTFPACVDVKPPDFKSCPEVPIVINLDKFGPNPVSIPWPEVTDNSGVTPVVTVQPDIWMPYRFTENLTITLKAKDEAGNSADCIINVIVIDETPPSIMCPTEAVKIFITSNKTAHITYKNADVTAYDNSGHVTVTYDPPEGSEVRTGEAVLVVASAVDSSHNVANCSFFARTEREDCPEWSLPTPDGGNKSCVPAGTSDKELICVVSCPAGKDFAVQPAEQYICSRKWLPHERVPQCLDARFPDYELRLSFNLPYQGSTTEECLKEMLDILVMTVKPRVLSVCLNATDNINLTRTDSVGAFSQTTVIKMEAKIKISIQQSSHAPAVTEAAHWCGENVVAKLEFSETLHSSCGQIILGPPSALGKNCCPEGYAKIDSMCYECPAGSYLSQPKCKECPRDNAKNVSDMVSCYGLSFEGLCCSEPQCLECPIGMFQNTSGSGECIKCPSGRSTLDVGAVDEKQCLAKCGRNHFSLTGLEPCLLCPVGTHQPKLASTSCEICEFNSNKESEFSYCKEPCCPGEYSSTGSKPCLLCPLNFYSYRNGSTSCTECSDNLVTKKLGSVSQSDCEAHDPCSINPCKQNSQCQPNGRDFRCECFTGYSGPTCNEMVQSCQEHLCHNGKCESHGSGIICACLPGFAGVNCEITVVDHCFSNPCMFGSCLNTSTGFTCSCYAGYTGDFCEVKRNNCAGVDCHSGACVDLITNFQCLCDIGFTGTYCDNKIDPCQESHCLNGGKCMDEGRSYKCTCPEGFKGDLCEENINDCASSPCLNNGLCLDGIGSYKCICLPEYTGNCCESIVNPCDIEPCVNGATCLSSQEREAGFYCRCKEGYTGNRCELNIDYCQSIPCSSEGSMKCENTDSSFKCHCRFGWTGHTCDEKLDPCHESPCKNGGTCRNEVGTTICSCSTQFTGPMCAISVNSCLSSPCQNLGTCVDKYPGFSCQCRSGFTGAFCETNINECVSSPCLYGGACQDGVDAFTCRCNMGYAGKLCEVVINECLSHPCQNNATCNQIQGDYFCSCNQGFTGKNCDTEINECSPNPCQHGGKCVDQLASFLCTCPQGYTGLKCEQRNDECLDLAVCLNNATCHKIGDKNVCQCTQYYTGPDCGKEKTGNFDLYYSGSPTSSGHTLGIHTGSLSELSLCLWVKFSQQQTYGTYLALTSEDGSRQLLSLSDVHATSEFFAHEEVVLNVNGGEWHHICLVMRTSNWTVFKDGHISVQGETNRWTLGNDIKLKLGQPVVNGDSKWFRGHLHGVNLYSSAVDEKMILNMSHNCYLEVPGDLFNWVAAQSQVPSDVQVTMPSQCGQTICSSGNPAQFCLSLNVEEGDRTSPEVKSCPETIVVTSENSPASVTWTEPVFLDNTGIVLVKQNFRPGQMFPHGQYLITYIGYDAENNSAECSFQIFVRKFSCVNPPPPANGARICGEWDHGRYCIPSCMHDFHFVTPIPPFYRCGQEGMWNPAGGDPFTFPACSRTYAPAHTIYGGISFEGPECSDIFQRKLQEKLVHILTQLDNVVHLCAADKVCNYTQGLNIECGQRTFRRRRSVDQQEAVYNVTFNFPLPTGKSDKQTSLDSMPRQIISQIKLEHTESEFFLASDNLHLSSSCLPGQILVNMKGPQCLNCPVGYFVSKGLACSPCPRGWYSENPLQTYCVKCADGQTTSSDAATSSVQCFENCKPGNYFNVEESKCNPCPTGEYQNQEGERDCKMCPMGLITRFTGAQSISDCKDICTAGQELGADGVCISCPYGTYRSARDASLFCSPCPYSFTTETEGSTDQTQCTIKKCDKGQFQNQDGRCLLCPIGTFQESLGATSCEPCGIHLTTVQNGSASRAMCIPGKVNECQLNIDSCSPGAKCIDLDDGYTCECKHGTSLTGHCVDSCENYCSSQKYCSNEANVSDSSECHCTVEMCRNENPRDSIYKSLVTASIVITVVAVVVLLIIIIVCLYRRTHQMNQEKHVRMYRDETELKSFTNEAFDSIHTYDELNVDEHSPQIPMKIATRWHNQSFVVSRPPAAENDSQSSDM